MRQIVWKLTFLSGLLLATGIACTDRTPAVVPSTAATAEIAPVVIEEPLTYTVVTGDFLSEIAARFDVEVDALVAANDIENAALIEVGQVLTIPGQQIVAGDLFFATAPVERFPDIYPPPPEPPPPALSPLDELRNRIAAWPWPPRDTMISGGVVAGFGLTAVIAGLLLARAEFRTRRWAVRATPRGARRAFKFWGDMAVKPRHAYGATRRRAFAAWELAVVAALGTWGAIKAADRRYRRARTAVILGWVRTKAHRERIAERAKPVLVKADDIAGRAVDVTLERSRDLIDTVRDRAPGAADGFNSLGERASDSVRRTVRTGAERARREVFEQPQPAERWRTRIAGELANAFERGQLQVRYVPVIDLDARALSAVEAHIFWQHPQRGLMAARDIYAATQDHPELGAALLEFLLEQSCGFVKDQVDARFPSAQLIVPVTLEQIVESEPLAAIDRGLTSANLAIDRLKVSIAEPHALQDSLTAAAFIRNLRSMGIGVHLDDYGIAPSEDLQYLGVSSVTVDFAAAASSEQAREILSEAVDAAQELRLPVTARHARSEAAQKLHVSLGCSFEAVGEPIPADAFVETYVAEPRPVVEPAAIDQPATSVGSGTPAPAAPALAVVGADPVASKTLDAPIEGETTTEVVAPPTEEPEPLPSTADADGSSRPVDAA